MKISPIILSTTSMEKTSAFSSSNFVPTTVRHNSLSDMEFNIIADTIRSQNLKNQMNIRLRSLKEKLNSCMARQLYDEA